MRFYLPVVTLAIAGATFAINAKAASNNDSHLAKQCQALALKAHPASLPNSIAVANLRNSYDALCLARHAKMDQELANGH